MRPMLCGPIAAPNGCFTSIGLKIRKIRKIADAQDLNSRRVDDTYCSSELTIKSLGIIFRASPVDQETGSRLSIAHAAQHPKDLLILRATSASAEVRHGKADDEDVPHQGSKGTAEQHRRSEAGRSRVRLCCQRDV